MILAWQPDTHVIQTWPDLRQIDGLRNRRTDEQRNVQPKKAGTKLVNDQILSSPVHPPPLSRLFGSSVRLLIYSFMDDYSASSQIDLSVHRFIAIHAFPFFGFRPALANTRLTLFLKKASGSMRFLHSARQKNTVRLRSEWQVRPVVLGGYGVPEQVLHPVLPAKKKAKTQRLWTAIWNVWKPITPLIKKAPFHPSHQRNIKGGVNSGHMVQSWMRSYQLERP